MTLAVGTPVLMGVGRVWNWKALVSFLATLINKKKRNVMGQVTAHPGCYDK